jgi:hypothetical protein
VNSCNEYRNAVTVRGHEAMRWRSGDWLIHFVHKKSVEGYEWEPMPEFEIVHFVGSDEETIKAIAPESLDARLGTLGCFYPDHRGGHHRALYNRNGTRVVTEAGAKYARDALRGFRHLCTTGERYEEWVRDVRAWGDDAYSVQQEHLKERKGAIVSFANRFGLLWGDNDPRSRAEWTNECSDFRVIDALARMLRARDNRAFRGRIIDDRSRGGGIRFDKSPWASGSVTLINNGQQKTTEATDGELVTIDVAQDFLTKSVPKQVWKVFAMLIGTKLDGGLTLAPGEFMGNQSGVLNKQLVDLLYLRLWLDVVQSQPVPRRCVSCGEDVVGGNRNRKFCSDACRQRHYRRKQARSA